MKTEIIARFNAGNASDEDLRHIEGWIESGEIALHELEGYAELLAWYKSVHEPAASQRMSDEFYQALANEKQKHAASWLSWLNIQWNTSPLFKLAYSLLLLLAGLAIGRIVGSEPNDGKDELASLTQEVTEMKEMIMLAMLEEESTSQRLKAVHLTSDLPRVTENVTHALFRTLNNDNNVNVRLATLEALYPYANDPKVREGLIQSIAMQDSPLVQVALAEMMVALQEKNSIQQLKRLLENDNTPEDVKREIESSINHLI